MTNEANIIAAFDEDHAARLSGVSRAQLSSWYRTGFFIPAYERSGKTAFRRVYSFHDIVSLRVLNTLRNQFRVSLQHLREVGEKLNRRFAENKWTGTKLYVLKSKVSWVDPDSEPKLPSEILSGQYIVPVVLDDVVLDTRKEMDKLIARNPETIGKIIRSRYINHNAPVVSGTRVRVSAIKAFSEAGYSVAQIIEEYPGLTEEDIHAALAYKKDVA
jgi:uncharacterized protein (DUF433 family)